MRNNYFESLKTYAWGKDYLASNPRKREVLDNANENGNVTILEGSNNRAVTIDNGETVFLQSYDTIVLAMDKVTREITKMWDGYSVTTMKHINTFLESFGLPKMCKREWEAM